MLWSVHPPPQPLRPPPPPPPPTSPTSAATNTLFEFASDLKEPIGLNAWWTSPDRRDQGRNFLRSRTLGARQVEPGCGPRRPRWTSRRAATTSSTEPPDRP